MTSTSDRAHLGADTDARTTSWADQGVDHHSGTPRDWKKLFLVSGLGLLSWVATYVGMLELIEANMGELPLVHKAIIGFSVAMLMVMVVWLLDQMFSDVGWTARILYAGGYVFLTLISVGFGFGFYWKVLESRSEASRSAESAVGQVQNSLHAAMTRLEQLQGTLDSLTAVSTQKADTERQTGASCPNSKPGDGPRRKMRDDDAGRFKFASDFVKGRVATVKSDIAALEGDLAKITKDDKSTIDAKSGTRNDFMRNLGRKLDMTVTGFNAFRTDPQLKQIRVDLNERSDKVTFVDTKGGTYSCPDSQLTTALKGVVRAIDELPVVEKPKIAAVEGSEAVIEAFRRLTATFYGALSFKLPPSPEELRELQKKAVQSVEMSSANQAKMAAMADQAGLSKRDYVPLAIALFVDLCLLLVSMKKGGSRLQNLVPKMRSAEQGPVIEILSRFNEIHRDKQIRENFEIFRHVVFDFHGDYYAAVPLNAPYRMNPRHSDGRPGYGVSDAEALLQEAHLLNNLFASFEKEKIFTRVYSPLLSTKAVQKRLRRQGSKFAASEAFRVYRFRNGAWSEIILGAVMGAARRVEAEKRARRHQTGATRDGEHSLPPLDRDRVEPAFHGAGEAAVGFSFDRDIADRGSIGGDAARRHQSFSSGMHEPSVMPMPQHGNIQPFPPLHRRSQATSDSESASSERAPRGDYSMARPPAAWPRPVAPPTPAEESPIRPANNNTGPAVRESIAMPSSYVLPNGKAPSPGATAATDSSRQSTAHVTQPRSIGALAFAPEPEERTVTVAATRETLTYTMPMSEAVVPNAFLAATASAVTAEQLRPVEGTSPRQATLPPPLPPLAPEAPHEMATATEKAESDQADPEQWSPAASVPASIGADEHDEFRALAMRLRPERRDG